MDETAPFEFRQCVSIHKSTGKKAGNLRELRDVIAQASEESIVHHNYQYCNQDQVFSLYNFGENVFNGNLVLPEVTWEKILESSSREWCGSRSTSLEKIETYDGNISLRIAPHSFVLYRMLKAS